VVEHLGFFLSQNNDAASAVCEPFKHGHNSFFGVSAIAIFAVNVSKPAQTELWGNVRRGRDESAQCSPWASSQCHVLG
jgi:hypothetical protein